MPRASFMQTSFLGGEYSDLVQGRMESQAYKIGLDLCQNYLPIEEGPLMRRPGTRYMGHTRLGRRAVAKPFDFSRIEPYQLEFTEGKVRFWRGPNLKATNSVLNVVSVASGVVTVTGTIPADWAAGDTVYFDLAERSDGEQASTSLENRQWIIGTPSGQTFTIYDALTGAASTGTAYVVPSAFTDGADTVRKVLELDTPYLTDDLDEIRTTQDDDSVIVLHPDYEPRIINEALATGDNKFGIGTLNLEDGPYYDIDTDATTTVTPSATTGSITLTLSAVTDVNGGSGWKETDVGRLVRLRSSPAAWAVGTTYSSGDTVTGTDDLVYVSIADSNLGNDPTSDLTKWSVSPSQHVWTWGEITAWTSTTVVTITISGDDLLNTTAINLNTGFRLGLYSDTDGWPTIAGYHEDRLWLAGRIANRVDGSRVGAKLEFNPTQSDGAVQDDNAVSATAFSTNVNLFRWMITDEQGLLLGTQNGEWRVRATATDDPITPFTIQMREVSGYGSADIEAVKASKRTVFVQRQRRKAMELFDESANDYYANNLNETAEHITASGIEEVRYVQEPTAVLWGRLTNGTLVGCSYRRTPDNYHAAWHKHVLADSRIVKSISSGPSFDTLYDRLYMVTAPSTDLVTDVHWMEFVQDLYDGNAEDLCYQFVDHAITPTAMSISGTTLTISGFHHLIGETVTGTVGGIDIGDHVVDANGQITVALGAYGTGDGDGLTEAYLQGLTGSYGECGKKLPYTTTTTATTTNTYATGARAWYETEVGLDPYDGNTIAFDNNRGYLYMVSDTTPNGIFVYYRTGGGDKLKEIVFSTLGTPGTFTTNSGAQFVCTHDGLIVFNQDSANTSTYCVLDPVTEEFVSFGTASGTIISSTPGSGHWATSHYVDDDGLTHSILMATTTLNTSTSIHNVSNIFRNRTTLDSTAADAAQVGTVAKTNGLRQYPCGSRVPINGMARFFHVETPLYGAAVATAWTVKRVDVNRWGATSTTIATPGPTDFDATWTNISAWGGQFVDQTDGNLILMAQTTDAVTYQTAIVKINAYTGAVMWRGTVRAAEASWPSATLAKMAENSRQRYAVFDATTDTIDIWDLTDGSLTSKDYSDTTTLTGAPQISDDATEGGQVVMYGSFTQGAFAGSMVGTFAQANTTWTNKWQALYLNYTHGITIDDPIETPASIGMAYTSKFQLLRPDYGNDAGAANGPAFAKTRRIDQFACAVVDTRQMSFGTDFNDLRPWEYRSGGGSRVDAPTLYTGTFRQQIENDYTYEGQICGQQTRPYPSIITAIAGFIQTQDL